MYIKIKCPHCDKNIDIEPNITVKKITKHKVEKRMKCSECSDHNHGCFGSGKESGLGHS